MDAASSFTSRAGRGAPRLLAHCAVLGRMNEFEHGSAWVRLERELGGDLARLLLVALLAGGSARSATVV